MPRLLSRFITTPEARKKVTRVVVAIFAVLAVLSWWTVYTEGASLAHVLTAVAATAVALIEALIPKRRRLLRRGTTGVDAGDESNSGGSPN